jgi:uncharacterized protein (DUF2236 family)
MPAARTDRHQPAGAGPSGSDGPRLTTARDGHHGDMTDLAPTPLLQQAWQRRRRPGAIPALLAPDGIPVLRDATEKAMRRMFGRQLDPTVNPGDPGLFGPGSATWALLSDPAVAVSGINALMIQTLHPRAMAGVSEHGSFEHDLIRRLHRTAAYVQAVNCGSMPEVLAASRRARGAHTVVRGTTDRGEAYAADEPRLLAWVSIGFTLSVLSVWDLLGPYPVDVALADAYVAEQAVTAALLDPRVDLREIEGDAGAVRMLQAGGQELPMIAEGQLPRTRADLDAAIGDFATDELELRQQARDGMAFLLSPPLEGAMLAGWRAVATASLVALPVTLRDIAGVPHHPVRDRVRVEVVRAAVDGLRVVHGRTSTIARATARATAGPVPGPA